MNSSRNQPGHMTLDQQVEQEAGSDRYALYRIFCLIDSGASLTAAIRGAKHFDSLVQAEIFRERTPEIIDYLVLNFAYNNNDEIVEALIQEHTGNINTAVKGYIQSTVDRSSKVDELIRRGVSLNWAVQCYAERGNDKKVEALIARGATQSSALIGYLDSNNIDKVA